MFTLIYFVAISGLGNIWILVSKAFADHSRNQAVMVRRIASQVHQQVSRLMKANFIQRPPVWYNAVLAHPPLPLPAKAPPARTPYDAKPQEPTKASNPKNPPIKPLPIYYVEDDIRRQFFRDHPFEAFRPRTLTEAEGVHPHQVSGKEWTRLRQRGRNPSSEEYVPCSLDNFSGTDECF
jgi:small subunit ribosomal protein S23